MKNQKHLGFSSNTGLDPRKIAKLPSQHSILGHHPHASKTPLSCVSLAGDDGPLMMVLGSSLPSSTKKRKKRVVKVGPILTKLSGSAHDLNIFTGLLVALYS